MFTADDVGREIRRVALDCDDAIVGPRRFRRSRPGWALSLPRPDLQRIEYRLVVTTADGSTVVTLDSGNDASVTTAFGERSVVLMPGYEPPAWLSAAGPGEDRGLLVDHVAATDEVGDLPVQVWSPAGLVRDQPAPLLLVHDGPEFVALADLDRYAQSMVSSGTLPAFRMMLCKPVDRDEWYAANAAYLAAERRALADVASRWPRVPGRTVAMGASLGGLSALLLAVTDADEFCGVVAQSGSFFSPALDPQESSYPWFGAVTQGVKQIVAESSKRPSMPVAMTCGRLEENAANNRAMAAMLAASGYDVHLTEVADLHNYTAWRDSWEPAVTDLLRICWT